MANLKQNRIEIRGLSESEINYLKALAEKNNAKSFNVFLLSVLREKIEYGQFNRAHDLYLAHLENMKLTTDHILNQTQKQADILATFEGKMDRYGEHISRWLEYEGEVENDD
ncbi:hypothetical protein Si122_00225 [Streptococcus infantarius subsp. infantarius]|nr:hypothetical protein [Streptococcus infantarius subsp. infantarius]